MAGSQPVLETVSFAFDRMTVALYRETSLRARWSDALRAWTVPGATARRRIDRWLATEAVRRTPYKEERNVELFTRARAGDFGDLRSFTSVFAQNVAEENSRGHNGYWCGPVPDMDTYPLNAVRNLFGAEPIAVHAVGTKTKDRGFNFDDTVAVTLLFPEERTAQFTVSYATASAENFSVVGTKATIEASLCFMFGPSVGIACKEITLEGEKQHTFEPVEQFGNETQYFSDCIPNDRGPEANGEEGLMDMRVLAAVETSLRTEETVSLPSASRSRHVDADQALKLKPAEQPAEDEMINIILQSK